MKCLAPVFLLACTLALGTGCKEKGYDSPAGYDLRKPQEMKLGKVLNEISGLSMMSDSNQLVAISDGKEKVFGIGLRKKKLKDLTGKVVPSGSDIEDVVATDSCYYLLASKGVVIQVPHGARDTAGVRNYTLPLDGKNDFETLYWDPTASGLVLICKTCAHEKGQGVRTAYRFDPRTKTFDSTAFFTIEKKDVEGQLKESDIKFDPSAAAISPIDKRLYILSSAGNLLVVTDTRGQVMEVYKLNPDKFPQAEGIAFAPNGDMYISNEGKYGKPTLLLFPYRKHDKKSK